jgi:hypothetical protein
MSRLLIGLALVSGCGIPESRYELVVHELFCERVAECNALLTQEECLLIPPEHLGLDCTYDPGLARECELALAEAGCSTDEVTGDSWFESPELCDEVWSCE